jgi:hypothetical protein
MLTSTISDGKCLPPCRHSLASWSNFGDFMSPDGKRSPRNRQVAKVGANSTRRGAKLAPDRSGRS